MRSAPRDNVTVVIIGSSSGVSPTASATENSSDSSTGRPNSMCAVSTTSTSARVSRAIRRPKACRSRWNGEGAWIFRQRRGGSPEHRGAACADDQRHGLRRSGRRPRETGRSTPHQRRAPSRRRAASRPDRARRSSDASLAVKAADFEHQGVGRNDVAGVHPQDVARNDGFDLDTHEAAVALDLGLERHRAPQLFGRPDRAAFLESCRGRSRRPRMATMIDPPMVSPVAAETMPAAKRISDKGSSRRRRMALGKLTCRATASEFGPYSASRASASALLRPSALQCSSAHSASFVRVQNGSEVGGTAICARAV